MRAINFVIRVKSDNLTFDNGDDPSMANTQEVSSSQKQKQMGSATWIGLLVFLAGAAFLIFRLFIADDKHPSVLTSPYANEIAAAFVGTLLTVIVTALLLQKTTESQKELMNQQTDHQAELLKHQAQSEENKEKNVAIYAKKLELYGELMKAIEEILCNPKPDSFIRMQFQAYRTGFIADKKVVHQLNRFAPHYGRAVQDNKISDDEWEQMQEPLAALVNAMKIDLDNHLIDGLREPRQADTATSQVPRSDTKVELSGSPISTTEPKQESLGSLNFTPKMNREEFLSQCEDSERAYFTEILDYCETHPDQIILDWGPKSVSIKDKERRQFLWMFPKEGANSKANINARTQHFLEKRAQIEGILRENGIAKGLSWRPGQFGVEATKKIINLVCGI